MPKAKVKRKGVVLGPEDGPGVSKKLCLSESDPLEAHTKNAQFATGDFPSTSKGPRTENFCSRIIPNMEEPNDPAPAANIQPYTKTLLDLPEEIICMILVKLDLASVAALQQACKHLHQLMVNARVWRRLLVHKVENEPGLRRFLPKHLQNNIASKDLDESSSKSIFAEMKLKLKHIWKSCHKAHVKRSPRLFGNLVENHHLYQIVTSGRYFAAYYMNLRNLEERVKNKEAPLERVRRHDVPTKPDTFRIIDEIKLFLVSYPNILAVEIISLEKEESDYIDLLRPGEVESGTVYDIVVREHICFRGRTHRWVVMIALNTEPVQNNQFHIGEIQFYSLSRHTKQTFLTLMQGKASAAPLARLQFHPVLHSDGRFFNQCIQKKGLSDFNEDHAVVVVGGCEGRIVLGVVDLDKFQIAHKLQLKGSGEGNREDGCGGFCQFTVVTLMIDRCQTSTCSVLLSTGQILVIHLPSGSTLFSRHLNYDGQLKLALMQPGFTGEQILAIKFRNFISFYKLHIMKRGKSMSIDFSSMRTITSVDADGRETKCDDNPAEELRKQFGELQKSLKALNHYTSGIQRKLDKGLRPGTVTQGVMSMTKKVQLVTSKLDQAHDKAKEIESVVIDSIAFDNRYCHALTLTRDLVTFDLAGNIENCELTGPSPSTSRRSSASTSKTKSKCL